MSAPQIAPVELSDVQLLYRLVVAFAGRLDKAEAQIAKLTNRLHAMEGRERV